MAPQVLRSFVLVVLCGAMPLLSADATEATLVDVRDQLEAFHEAALFLGQVIAVGVGCLWGSATWALLRATMATDEFR